MAPSVNMYFSTLRDCSLAIYLHIVVNTWDFLQHHNCFIVLLYTHLRITENHNSCSNKDAYQMYSLFTSVSITVLTGFLYANSGKAFSL